MKCKKGGLPMQAPTILRCFYHGVYLKPHQGPRPAHWDKPRLVKDYEFDLYLHPGRKIQLNGEWHEMEEGTLMVRRPGDVVSGFGSFGCYMLTLDFSNTKKEIFYDRNETQDVQLLCNDELLQVLPVCFKPRRLEECVHLMRQMALRAPLGPARDEEDKQLVMEFLHLLAADAYHVKRDENSSPDRLISLCGHMQQHYSREITLDSLAEYVNLDKSYLIRLFKQELGVTPMTYLARVRMENARLLLAETDESIAEIARRCGFQTATYFHTCFKKMYGMTPMAYRQKSRK
ncbi:MAG: helix-turn-helix transcriptional regulator [Clostridiales bacterium]|nr:helix-turn-helix transcriptional regulator [Clostridiales bacterium]